MFRFSIRDVLWLTVVVAVALGWYLEREGSVYLRSQAVRLDRENETLTKELEDQKKRADANEAQNKAFRAFYGIKGL
jgi:hypothetical protein